jgi:hypothetical protein
VSRLPISGSWLSDLAIITIPVVILAMMLDRKTLHGLIIRRISQAMMVATFAYAFVAMLSAIASNFLA